MSKRRYILYVRSLLALAIGTTTSSAFGWIYPEHREIAMLAVQGLDEERRVEFDQLWQDARLGDEQRLCAQGADAEQGLSPKCIDWTALPGIAGDHSCSSQEMLETVRTTDWILTVAAVAAQLKADLAKIPVTAPPGQGEGDAGFIADVQRRIASETSRAARLNALRTADSRLQRGTIPGSPPHRASIDGLCLPGHGIHRTTQDSYTPGPRIRRSILQLVRS